MTSAKRASRRAARDATAAQLEQEQREAEAAQRVRRQRRLFANIAIGVAVVILISFVVIKLTAPAGVKHGPSVLVSGVLASELTQVPASVFDTVGRGSVGHPPTATKGEAVLTDGTLPVVFYMGAEFCPYCAAQRWSLIVALSRFGTFTGLHTAWSDAHDVYPSTPSFSLYGSTYTSPYVELQAKEIMSDYGVTLAKLTADQQAIVTKLDPPDKGSSGNPFPFVSFGNQAVTTGASYDPGALGGKSQEQIAAKLSDPNDSLTKKIIGTANAFTAQICALTHDAPASVCTSKGATAYSGK